MKKYTLALFLGSSSAIRLNSRFIDGNFDDDNDVINQLSQREAQQKAEYRKNLEDMSKIKAKDQIKLAMSAEVHTGVKSDPIFGSNGPTEKKPPPATPEEALERDLQSRKPVDFGLDPDQHPETQDSITWAENHVGAKLPDPVKSKIRRTTNQDYIDENFDYDEDADIATTLKSAHQAEELYGYHQRQHYGYGGYGNGGYGGYGGYEGYGGYGYGNGNDTLNFKNMNFTNGNYSVSGNDYEKYQYGYGGYGNHNNHPDDWWNHLVKDHGENGMVSNQMKAHDKFKGNVMENGLWPGYHGHDINEYDQFVRQQGIEAAKGKQTDADKQTAKDMKKLEGKEEGKEEAKEGKEEAKEGAAKEGAAKEEAPKEGAPKEEAKKEEGKKEEAKKGDDFVPPELADASKTAAVQVKAKSSQKSAVQKKESPSKQPSQGAINIGGVLIRTGDMDVNDIPDTEDLAQTSTDAREMEDHINLMTGAELEESNQEKLARLMA